MNRTGLLCLLLSLSSTFSATAEPVPPAAGLPMPMPSAAAAADDPLDRHLRRLEDELRSRPPTVEDAAHQKRLLHHLRFLRARTGEGRTAVSRQQLERIRALEVQVRTGKTMPLLAPDHRRGDKGVGSATISGTVTRSPNGAPIADVDVYLWDESGSLIDLAFTNGAGNYELDFVFPGRYYLSTQNFAGFLDEIYDGFPCPRTLAPFCDVTVGTPIDLADGGTAQADFALVLGGSITGAVTAAGTGERIDAYVTVYDAAGGFVGDSFAGTGGQYLVEGLPAGSYFVATNSFGSYRDEIYDDRPCLFPCDATTGDAVAVALETTTSGIDFVLNELGSIAGTVVDSLSGDPIPFLDLTVRDAEGSNVQFGFTDDSGEYTVGGLPPGNYFVTTRNFYGFADELYDDLPCPFGACDPTTGTPILVALDSTTAGIDFELAGGCVETETVLCLNSERFRIEARWRDFADNTGSGHAVRLSDDTGYFWFFADGNVEQLVKVLNACGLPGFNNFWVFAAGLTNVEVTLTVTDVRTGQTKQYVNPIGVAFQPVQDTTDFRSCP